MIHSIKVWIDARAVNVIAEQCFSNITRNAVNSVRFFLGIDDEIDDLLAKEEEDDNDDENEAGKSKANKQKELRAKLNGPKVKKQTKKVKREMKNAAKELKKLSEGASTDGKVVVDQSKDAGARKRKALPRFPAIELIHDPLAFIERLFKIVKAKVRRKKTLLGEIKTLTIR